MCVHFYTKTNKPVCPKLGMRNALKTGREFRKVKTQPPVQWVSWVLSPGLKGVTLTTDPPLLARLRMSRSYTPSSPKHLHGMLWESFSFRLFLHLTVLKCFEQIIVFCFFFSGWFRGFSTKNRSIKVRAFISIANLPGVLWEMVCSDTSLYIQVAVALCKCFRTASPFLRTLYTIH
jgi:hypothetical protein